MVAGVPFERMNTSSPEAGQGITASHVERRGGRIPGLLAEFYAARIIRRVGVHDPPWRLALVTLMPFRENLADRQAAEAVRARIDWKYLLSLELRDPGFDFSVLSEFRDR